MPTPDRKVTGRQITAGVFAVARVLLCRGKYEAAALFSILMAYEWLHPATGSLARIQPHPFWIPVILITVQYGRVSGLVVTAFAAALGWIAGWPPQTAQEDFFAYSLRVWREPALWTALALIVGSLRNRHIRDAAKVDSRLRETAAQLDLVAEFCSELQQHVAASDRATAIGRAGSLSAALDALEALHTSSASEIKSALDAAIKSLIGEATWQVVVPCLSGNTGGGEWHIANRSPPHLTTVATTPADWAFFDALERRGGLLSFFCREDAPMLDDVGLFACSIPGQAEDSSAALVITTMDLAELKPVSAAAVRLISLALGSAWARADARLDPKTYMPAEPLNTAAELSRQHPGADRLIAAE